MHKSNDFNDDSDDDLEHEPWDEDAYLDPPSYQDEEPASFEEPHDQVNKKKESSRFLLPIFLIGILGSGYYYYSSSTKKIDLPPIVNLELPQADAPPLATSENDPPKDFSIELPEQQSNAQNPEEKQVILTPLPDNTSNIQLPPLVVNENQEPSNKDEESILPPIASDIEKSPSAAPIEEQDILSRTEEVIDVKEEEEEKLTHVQDGTTKTKTDDSADPLKLDEDAHQKQVQKPAIKEKISDTNEVVTKPPSITDKIVWKIKGASPQSAVIYNKNSGETRSIEPGNTVKGLGRIKSIGKENGKWVVIGTTGRAEQ